MYLSDLKTIDKKKQNHTLTAGLSQKIASGLVPHELTYSSVRCIQNDSTELWWRGTLTPQEVRAGIR